MIVFKIKNYLKSIINKSKFSYIFNFLYLRIKRSSEREQIRIQDKNKETVYIIRPRTDGIEGLMSLFLEVMKKINYARNNNMKVFVDFKNYFTQYYIPGENAWNYFFEQPDNINENDLEKYNQVLSGYTLKSLKYPEILFTRNVFFDKETKILSKTLIKQNIRFPQSVINEINTILLEKDIENSIGIYLRGTDYTTLKPSGEPIQPSVKMAEKKIDEFIEKYKNPKLFLVTEDMNIYKELKIRYDNNLFTIDNDSFIDGYTNGFLSQTNLLDDNNINRGFKYLIKILLLSKCKYFISSITNGSIAAYLLKDVEYQDEYIFNLGTY